MSSIPIKVITAKSYQSLPELFDRAHDILMACHAVQEDYIHTALLREKASTSYWTWCNHAAWRSRQGAKVTCSNF